MRCSSCKHKWLQEPPADEKAAVTPSKEKSKGESADKPSNIAQRIKSMMISDIRQGYVTIIIGFSFMLAVAFLYQMLNPKVVMGEGLVFENIVIKRDLGTIEIHGDIVNTMKDSRGIPDVSVTQLFAHNIQGDGQIIPIEQKILNGGSNVTFTAIIDSVDPNIENIRVGFVGAQLKSDIKKHKEEDADAHHEKTDDENHH